MPKKIRELKKQLLKAGFSYRQGKGSHIFWSHPFMSNKPITIVEKDKTLLFILHKKKVIA